MTESIYRIRRMEGRDISAVVGVDRLVFTDPWPESAYVQELYFNVNARYFVLQLLDLSQWPLLEGEKSPRRPPLLGFVGMRVEGTRGHISTLAIRPEWRGRKLGECLLLTAMVEAVNDNASTIGLEVRVSNMTAQNLYRKYGYQPTSRLRRYYANGEDAFYMRVDLIEPAYRQHLNNQLAELVADLDVDFQAWKPPADG